MQSLRSIFSSLKIIILLSWIAVSCSEVSFTGSTRKLQQSIANGSSKENKDNSESKATEKTAKADSKTTDSNLALFVPRETVKKNESPFKETAKFTLVDAPTETGSTIALTASASTDKVLPAGEKINLVLNEKCIAEKKPQSAWIQAYIDENPLNDIAVLKGEFIFSIALKEAIDSQKINALMKADPCIVGASVDNGGQLTPSASASALAAVKDLPVSFDESDRKFFEQLNTDNKTPRVRIAVIDTGFDTKNQDFAAEVLKNINAGYGDLSDPTGHGTSVAALIASKNFGLAEKFVEILPVKLTQNSISGLYNAIAFAVNQRADIINISASTQTFGCDATIGQAIFKAIDSGILFTFAAGNGFTPLVGVAPKREDVLGPKLGYPIIGVNDDREPNYGMTETPACWGRYFHGAMSVAAIGGPKASPVMPQNSNFGDDIELAAPGVGIKTYGADSSLVTLDGTSMSTAFVTAASAMAIYHHRKYGFTYDPWYIEDVIIQAASRNDEFAKRLRRVRLGTILDYSGLAKLLKSSEALTNDQRRAIPTINPRIGQGYNPGLKSNLSRIEIKSQQVDIYPGDEFALNGTVFYRNNQTEQDKTLSPETYWTAGTSARDLYDITPIITPYFQVDAKGKVKIGSIQAFEDLSKKVKAKYPNASLATSIPISAVVSYVEDDTLIYTARNFSVYTSPKAPQLTEVGIELQGGSNLQAGEDQIVLTLQGKYSDLKIRDLTAAATFTSSNQAEFRSTASPGIFDARNAKIGGTYVVTATYQNFSATATVKLKDDPLLGFNTNLSIGVNPEVEAGQKFSAQAIASFKSKNIPYKADWYLDGQKIATDQTELIIDSINLSIGNHNLEAKAKIASATETKDVSSIAAFKVSADVARIQAQIKTPFPYEDSYLALDVVAYRANNSTNVVTDKATLQISDTVNATIDSSGRVYIKKGSAGKSFSVTATYKGKTDTISFIATKSPIISGVDLVDLLVTFSSGSPSSFCKMVKTVVDVTAVYKDGTTRRVTSLAQITTTQISPAGVESPFAFNTMYGGGKVKSVVSYTEAPQNGSGGGFISKEVYSDIPAGPLSPPVQIDRPRPIYGNLDIIADYGCGDTIVSYDIPAIFKKKLLRNDNFYITWQPDWNAVPDGVYPYSVTYRSRALGVDGTYTYSSTFKVSTPGIANVTVSKPLNATYDVGNYVTTSAEFLLLDSQNKYVYSEMKEWDFNIALNFYSGKSSPVISYTNLRGGVCVDRTQFNSGTLTYTMKHIPSSKQAVTSATINMLPMGKAIPVAKITPANRSVPSSKKQTNFCNTSNRSMSPFAGGKGTQEDPYRICTTAQFANNLTVPVKYSQLEDNLDFNNSPILPVTQAEFFNGNGFEMRNFFLQEPLFKFCPKQISNLGIVNAQMQGTTSAAVLCASGNTAYNSYIVGSTITGEAQVGSFFANNGTVIDSFISNTKIFAGIGPAGGFCGTGCTVLGSSANIDIKHNGLPYTGIAMGGLVGDGGAASESQASGLITATGTYFGGLIGRNASYVVNSTSSVEINAFGTKVGGLVGANDSSNMFVSQADQSAFKLSPVLLPDGTTSTTNSFTRPNQQPIIMNSSSSGIIAGYNCEPGKTEVFGSNGTFPCPSQSASTKSSGTGGLLGQGSALIVNSSSSSTIRSTTDAGGLVGFADGAIIQDSSFSGMLSLSSTTGFAGKLVGRANYGMCTYLSAADIKKYFFLGNNTWTDNQQDTKWAIGILNTSNANAPLYRVTP